MDLFDEFAVKLPRNDPSDVLPEDVWGGLRNYQQRLLRWIIDQNGRAFEAFAPRTGKTFISTAALLYYQILWRNAFPVLIIGPSKVKREWRNVLTTFGQANKSSVSTREINRNFVVITPKSAVLKQKEVLEGKFNTVILDESRQYFSDVNTQFCTAFSDFLKEVRYLLLCSGTALDANRHLWCPMHHLRPKIFTDKIAFENRFCGRHLEKNRKNEGSHWDIRQSTNSDELYRILKHNGYRYASKEMIDTLRGTPAIENKEEIVKMPDPRPRKIQRYAGLSEMKKADSLVEQTNEEVPFRISRVIEYLEENPITEPTILFVNYMMMADAIEQFLCQKKIDCERVDGGCSDKKSEAAIESFQKPDGPKAIIVAMRAAGAGISLTRGTKVIFTELPFDDTVFEQCKNRPLGMNQTKSVTFVLLTCENKMFCDSRLLSIIRRKESNIGRINRS
jgi:SNF2 family DNA or RNA helicase